MLRDEVSLSDEERKAIRALQRPAKRWPKSLWLFCGSAPLAVMKCKPDGSRAYVGGRVDPDYKVGDVDLPNDGGDW